MVTTTTVVSGAVLFIIMAWRTAAAGYTWANYKTIHKLQGIKNNTNFGKITGIEEKLDTTCK